MTKNAPPDSGSLKKVFSLATMMLVGMWLAMTPRCPASAETTLIEQGKSVRLGKEAPGKEGTVLLVLKPGDAPADHLLFQMGEEKNWVRITLQQVSFTASGTEGSLPLPSIRGHDPSTLAVRWKPGVLDVWVNNARIAARGDVTFETFSGKAVCGEAKAPSPPMLQATLHAAFLSEADIAHHYHSLRFSNEPYMTIPYAEETPVIDGKLAAGEWDVATEITGLAELSTGYLTQPGSRFRVCYDAERMYVAYHGPIPKRVLENLDTEALHGFVKTTKTSFDSDVEKDDSVAVTVVPTYPTGIWHRMLTNHIQTHYDLWAAPDGGIKLDWNPDWHTASEVGVDGWTMEIAFPLDAIQADRPKTGTVWGMNFFRVWRQLLNRTDEWATGRRLKGSDVTFRAHWGTSRTVGQVEFGGRNALFVKLKSIEGFDVGEPKLVLEVANAGDKDEQAVIVLKSNTGDISTRKQVTVPAHGTSPFSFSGEIVEPNTNTLSLSVTAGSEHKLIYRTALHFRQKQSLECVPRFYPSYDRLELDLDLSKLKNTDPADMAAALVFTSTETTKIVLQKNVATFDNHYPKLTLATDSLPVGQYDLTIDIDIGEKTVESLKRPFEKRETPDWRHNRIGMSHRVPPPFNPVEVEGTTLSMWGRKYDFGNSLFPKTILVDGTNILAGPVHLTLTPANSQPVTRLEAPALKISRAGTGRVEWTASGALGGLRVESRGWGEYDGFLWFDMTIHPSDKGETRVDSLALEIPVRREWSTLLNNFDYSLQTTGLAPEGGLKKGNSPIWLGNEKGGLQWLSESLAGCRIADPVRCVRLVCDGTSRRIRIMLVDHPLELTEPINVSFGLVATPIRPAGDWQCFGGILNGIWHRQAVYSPKTDWGNPLAFTNWGLRFDENGRITRDRRPSYIMTSRVAFTEHDKTAPAREMMRIAQYWIYEWAAGETVKWTPEIARFATSQASESWRDFWLWNFATMYLKQPYAGVYYDVSRPVVCTNPYAVSEAKRSMVPLTTFLGNRDMAKRLYTFLRLQQPQGLISYHMSGQPDGSALGFTEMIVDGENLYSFHTSKEPHAYLRMTLPMFRAQFLGYNFGPPSLCLWQQNRVFKGILSGLTPQERRARQEEIYGDPDREARWCAGMVVLHNTIYNGSYCPSSTAVKPIEQAWKNMGINTRTYSFHGYWDQDLVTVAPERDDLVCSVYRAKKDERAMLVLFNNTDWNGSVSLRVDWKQLGIDPKNCTIANKTGAGDEAMLEGQVIKLPVTARDVRIVAVEENKTL